MTIKIKIFKIIKNELLFDVDNDDDDNDVVETNDGDVVDDDADVK